MHDVASILKEFFKDLPEPLLPREVYHPLLAIQSKSPGYFPGCSTLPQVTGDQCGPLSLVEIQRGSALIGRELHSVATPVSLMP